MNETGSFSQMMETTHCVPLRIYITHPLILIPSLLLSAFCALLNTHTHLHVLCTIVSVCVCAVGFVSDSMGCISVGGRVHTVRARDERGRPADR